MDTNFNAISNFISDCYQYFSDSDLLDTGSDSDVVYRLLALADDICSKHFSK